MYIWERWHLNQQNHILPMVCKHTQIARFMRPTWGPPGSLWPQVGPTLTPRILLSGYIAASGYGLKVWTRVPNTNIIWQYKLYTTEIKSFLYSKLINIVLSFLQYVSHTSHQVNDIKPSWIEYTTAPNKLWLYTSNLNYNWHADLSYHSHFIWLGDVAEALENTVKCHYNAV